jgi:hypothetical protein
MVEYIDNGTVVSFYALNIMILMIHSTRETALQKDRVFQNSTPDEELYVFILPDLEFSYHAIERIRRVILKWALICDILN